MLLLSSARGMACANYSFFVQKELFGDLIVSHLNMDSTTFSDVESSGFVYFQFKDKKHLQTLLWVENNK